MLGTTQAKSSRVRDDAARAPRRFLSRLIATSTIVVGAVGAAAAGCGENSENPEWSEPISTQKEGIITKYLCEPNCSSWVFPSAFNNHLIYVPDQEGDRIADFSRVGYKKGANGLPSVSLPQQTQAGFSDPVIDLQTTPWPKADGSNSLPPPQTLAAPSDLCNPDHRYDHTLGIQTLLNAVANRPADANGVRGRVYLPRGHYAIWGAPPQGEMASEALIVGDGVVLRGISEDATSAPATTLHACDHVEALIQVGVGGGYGSFGSNPSPRAILDDNVPSGSNSIRLAAGHGLSVGDVMLISRIPCANESGIVKDDPETPVDEAEPLAQWKDRIQTTCNPIYQWLIDIGMLDGWTTPSSIDFQVTVTAIQAADNKNGVTSDSLVFFDPPVTTALEGKYGPHTATRYSTKPNRTKNMGVFRLRGFSQSPNPTVPQVMIWLSDSEDVWISEIVAERFSMSAVKMTERTRWATVDIAEYRNDYPGLGPDDGGYRYAFSNRGQWNLIAHAYANHARHAFMGHKWMPGPNVFLESVAENTHQDSGAHQKWQSGTLFDNVRINSGSSHWHSTRGQINAENREESGTAQGFAGSSIVAWNSHAAGASGAAAFNVFSPIVNASSYVPGGFSATGSGQNWLIGATAPSTVQLLGAPTASDKEAAPHLDFYATGLTGPGTQTGILAPDDGSVAGYPLGKSLYRTAATKYRYVAPPSTAATDYRTYFVGDTDDFTLDASEDIVNDSVYVNPLFKTWIGTTSAISFFRGFDYIGSSDEKSIPFSIRYDLAANEQVRYAYLAVRMKRVGGWGQDSDHYVQIAGAGTTATLIGTGATTLYWRCTDGTCSSTNVMTPPNPDAVGTPEMAGPPGWNIGNTPGVRILDLGHPNVNGLLNRFITQGTRRYGELHFNFGRRTRIDWAMLVLFVEH